MMWCQDSGFKILTQLQLNKVMGVCVPGVFTAHCKVKMTSQLIVCERSAAGGGPVDLLFCDLIS